MKINPHFRLPIMIFFLAISINTFAQNTDSTSSPRHYWALSVGAAIPQGNFANNSFNNYYASFAQTGFNISSNYYFYACRFLALNTDIQYNYLPYDNKAYINEYKKALNSNNISTNTGPYQLITLMGGLALKTSSIWKFELIYTMRTGLSIGHHPELKVIEKELGQINYIPASWGQSIAFNHDLRLLYYHNKSNIYFIQWGASITNIHFSDTGYYDDFYQIFSIENINLGYQISF